MFDLPMVQRRYVIAPPGLLPCHGHHDNRSLKGGASALMPASPKVGERDPRKIGMSSALRAWIGGAIRRPKMAPPKALEVILRQAPCPVNCSSSHKGIVGPARGQGAALSQ